MGGRGRRLLLLGRNGFIARAILEAAEPGTTQAIAHTKIDETDLADIACIIGCARNPTIHRDDYEIERDDPDVRLAGRIGTRPIRFILLSTRKVYAPAVTPLTEDAPLGPTDAYGRNKLRVEERLREILGERLVVVRLANLFGFEVGAGRQTFFATMLRDLKERGQIRFEMSPFVERDFLPVGRAAHVLLMLADPRTAPPRVLNLGSGIGSPCGRLALAVMEGFGRGELVITRPDERDAFVLDISGLAGLVGPVIDAKSIIGACRAIGRRLREPGPP